jgi:hypothetical protein
LAGTLAAALLMPLVVFGGLVLSDLVRQDEAAQRDRLQLTAN